MNFYKAIAATCILAISSCATGGQTQNGNATGGSVSTKIGDICAGMTASCGQPNSKPAEEAEGATE
ncbi:hypothetical protein MYG64_07360 [Ensifer adhaerens]|uniref:hypothetical protein n=1 Tax=Ensifer adhaerens TaxID=106592 RepID=UPI002100BC95|nr:hypothetical protein [Ensifer adhaerens]UTV38103.1 hypothetical protein MYG64_07360 [Ensifer adhaerens]